MGLVRQARPRIHANRLGTGLRITEARSGYSIASCHGIASSARSTRGGRDDRRHEGVMSDADTARQPTDISQSFFRTMEAKVGVAQNHEGPWPEPSSPQWSRLPVGLKYPLKATHDGGFNGSLDQRRRPVIHISGPIDALDATTIPHGRDPDRVPMNPALIQYADLRSPEIAGERRHAASHLSPGSVHRVSDGRPLQVDLLGDRKGALQRRVHRSISQSGKRSAGKSGFGA